MRNIVLLGLLIFTMGAADEFVVANKICQATNNLKATKNSGDATTKIGQKYRVLSAKPSSIYIDIQTINPNGRWVDKSCFDGLKSNIATNDTQAKVAQNHNLPKSKPYKQSLLALSWHDGFCETHRDKVECKRGVFGNKEHGFVLHGLWPQPKNLAYCGVDKKIVGMDKSKQWTKMPNINLTPQVANNLAIVMPAIASSLQNHEWYKHGTCSGMNSTEYFAKATKFTNEFNGSKLAKFIEQNRGKSVTINEIRTLANSSFGAGSGDKIEMICSGGLLSELRINLGVGDSLKSALQTGVKTKSGCQKGLIDRAGW